MYGDVDTIEYKFLLKLMEQNIDFVMGEGNLVQQIQNHYPKESMLDNKILYKLEDNQKLVIENLTKGATLGDVDEIHEFLMSIDEIKHLYTVKDMINNRIKNNEGTHLFIKDNGKIIAHANSAGGTNRSSMVGGISVDKNYRNKGYGKRVVSEICNKIILENKIACLFEKEEKANLFIKLGFKAHAKWGLLKLN